MVVFVSHMRTSAWKQTLCFAVVRTTGRYTGNRSYCQERSVSMFDFVLPCYWSKSNKWRDRRCAWSAIQDHFRCICRNPYNLPQILSSLVCHTPPSKDLTSVFDGNCTEMEHRTCRSNRKLVCGNYQPPHDYTKGGRNMTSAWRVLTSPEILPVRNRILSAGRRVLFSRSS